MRLCALILLFAATLCMSAPVYAADQPIGSEQRRNERRTERKAEDKAKGVAPLGTTAKEQETAGEALGKTGKTLKDSMADERLDYGVTQKFRDLFKMEKEKLLKEQNLRAQTEEEERRARAEAAKREAERREEHRLRVSIEILFDW